MSRKSLAVNTQPMYVLEESFYPDAWRDDSRMGVLLSEFRVRTINPENYDSKMKFWKELTRKYCEHKGHASVSIGELKRVFKRKGTSPYCLPTVFDDMLREGQLVAKDQFLRVPQESWGGWAVDLLVKRPLGWGFGKVKEKVIGSTLEEDAEFVCLEVVKNQAATLDKLLQTEDKYNQLISMHDLLAMIKDSEITSDGVHLVLHNMISRQRVVMEKLPSEVEDNKKVLLKFATPSAKAQPITDIERSIYNLEQTEHDLMQVIEKLEHSIDETMTTVKENIREGKKQLAKSNLKKKHLLEKNLDKKMNVLENVQSMLSRIHDSQHDRKVIEAYKIGSNALKNAFADSGITLDSVDDTLAEMKEIIDQQDEMQMMISAPQATDVDELELEQELSDLIDMKLAESNIPIPPTVPVLAPAAAAAAGPAPPAPPSQPSSSQPSISQLNDFDKEIEKRLAALKMDVSHDVSISGGTVSSDSGSQQANLPSTPA